MKIPWRLLGNINYPVHAGKEASGFRCAFVVPQTTSCIWHCKRIHYYHASDLQDQEQSQAWSPICALEIAPKLLSPAPSSASFLTQCPPRPRGRNDLHPTPLAARGAQKPRPSPGHGQALGSPLSSAMAKPGYSVKLSRPHPATRPSLVLRVWEAPCEAQPLPFPLLLQLRPRAARVKVSPLCARSARRPSPGNRGTNSAARPLRPVPGFEKPRPPHLLSGHPRAGLAPKGRKGAEPAGKGGATSGAVRLAAPAPAPSIGGLSEVFRMRLRVAGERGGGGRSGRAWVPIAASSEPEVFSLYDQASRDRRCWSRA